jgi:hypothetical protein
MGHQKRCLVAKMERIARREGYGSRPTRWRPFVEYCRVQLADDLHLRVSNDPPTGYLLNVA